MKLCSVEVTNCRSIERATFASLSQVNVLVGRNNSGKSAFFRALWHLAQKVNGQSVEWSRTIRYSNPRAKLGLRLTFELSLTERSEFIDDSLRWSAKDESRLNALLGGPLARQVEFHIATVAGNPNLMHIYETKLFCEDAKWAHVHRMTGHETNGNPTALVTQFESLDPHRSLSSAALSLDTAPKTQINIALSDWNGRTEGWAFLQRLLTQFIRNAFFFLPSRSSSDQLPAQAVDRLAPDGSNLPQVLLRIRANHDQQFDAIVQMIKGALPDVGQLQTPMNANQTSVGFRQPGLRDPIPLLDMGTGVQQLLMMAVLLATTGEETSLFIEEPESNLHPGAQRYLLSRLQAEQRQVFMTTHSPILVNVRPPNSIHRVMLTGGSTKVDLVKDSDGLAEALNSIGAQNSDVLLSDTVLFVEGPSDREILLAWSRVLRMPLDERGVTILTLGGSDGGHRPLRIRKEVLEGVSRASHIPHKFVIDRDERSDADLQGLRDSLGNTLHVLGRRELENFLLTPNAIAAVISEARSRRQLSTTVDLSYDRISRRIQEVAVSLRGTVLLKRIRAVSSRLPGGPFPREALSQLSGLEDHAELPARIKELLSVRFSSWLGGQPLEDIVASERERVNTLWKSGTDAILSAAPGTEILEAIFAEYDVAYDKNAHGARIAAAMKPEDVAPEIREIIAWTGVG